MSKLRVVAGRCSVRSRRLVPTSPALIRQSLRAIGRADDTKVTAFTDGCAGLRSILIDAGMTTPPILDWFHIAMRIQHAAQTASGLPADDPSRMQAKTMIVEEVERLRWRIGTARPRMPDAASIGSARSCMYIRKNEANTHGARHHTGCGTRCTMSTAI